MSLLDSTCVYQLQPVDVRRGTVRKSQRHGHLVCDAEADWHSRLNLGTDSFTSFVTKGDGGCALHAVWGHPSSTGELALATGQNVGRQEIARLLPETLHAFQGACPGSDAVITSIWSELTLPALEGTTDTEPCLFWSQLQKDQPGYAAFVASFYEQRQYDKQSRIRARSRYQASCNAVFTPDNEKHIVRPVLISVGSDDLRVDDRDMSRYRLLFVGHGDRDMDLRRESVLESLNAIERQRAFDRIDSLAKELDAQEEDVHVMVEWKESFLKLREQTQLAPSGFDAVVWPTYKSTITKGEYYLSVSEIIAIARLARTHLVVLSFSARQFKVVDATFDENALVKPVVICLHDDGTRRVRGHFERVWPWEDLEQCVAYLDFEKKQLAATAEKEQEQANSSNDHTPPSTVTTVKEDVFDYVFPELTEEIEDAAAMTEYDRMRWLTDDIDSGVAPAPAAEVQQAEGSALLTWKQTTPHMIPEGTDSGGRSKSQVVTSPMKQTYTSPMWCSSYRGVVKEQEEQDEESSASDNDNDLQEGRDPLSLTVSARKDPENMTEQDVWEDCCQRLATHLRDRPTLPASWKDTNVSFKDVDSGVRLPLYSCPFRGCVYATNDRVKLLRHLAGEQEQSPHLDLVKQVCRHAIGYAQPLDFIHGAIAHIERKQVPLIGLSVSRRALATMTTRCNDTKSQALICFVCGQIHPTISGPEHVDLSTRASRPRAHHTIEYKSCAWLQALESSYPGTFLNNCSYELWKARYVPGTYDEGSPPEVKNCLQSRQPRRPTTDGPQPKPEYHMSEWVIGVALNCDAPLGNDSVVKLFGVTEDIICNDVKMTNVHVHQMSEEPCFRILCPACRVPICHSCVTGLSKYDESLKRGTVPMAIANDNYYGYALKLLVEKNITWLECAAASLVWTTLMVYYLEAPYGDLMLETMVGPQARTQVRGNVFSFSLPTEEIEQRCIEAEKNWGDARSAARGACRLPHDEETLCTLVSVHIVGGTTDLAKHLKGATMRTQVVRCLISELRASGYAGYNQTWNQEAAVEERMQELYESKYGSGPFIPHKIQEEIDRAHRAKLSGSSLIHDKNATPAEPITDIAGFEDAARPMSLVAQRSSKGATTSHEEHGDVFARYQKLEIQTGSKMMDQFRPQYIGLAHPFTMPAAVGGYDMPGKARWRRPTQEQVEEKVLPESSGHGLPMDEEYFARQRQTAATTVTLRDMTQGLTARVEAQFRRHWGFMPCLWNLYFRERLNLGASLSGHSTANYVGPEDPITQDAGMAAASCYELLEKGYYLTQDNKRRKIDGDLTKLRFAENITPLQKKLLADFNFRTSNIPGTQEIRTKIGHVCFWGSIVYGNGIFMTVSPGERHNYLAIRLSRYRARDPYITGNDAMPEEARWIHRNSPSLKSDKGDRYEFEVPGYDLRQIILARDPLCAAQAFAIQMRQILAAVRGQRMCPHCPHCAESELPCQDAFGSNAEAMGGCNGRSDAQGGAVECQKSKGALHLHFWDFIERLHQYHTLEEVAEKIQQRLVESDDLKKFCSNICCEEYPDIEKHNQGLKGLERRWPRFHEKDGVSVGENATWGENRFGRIPAFVWEDQGPTYSDLHMPKVQPSLEGPEVADKLMIKRRNLMDDAEAYREQFNAALQENQECAQHHIHKMNPKTGERTIPNACRASGKKGECKHDFPMTHKMNDRRPLLICKGLAKKLGLRSSGKRNMLGCIYGKRNSPWLNGTSPAFCLGLSGSNSDVKMNDRIPITEETHESTECTRRCVPADHQRRERALRRLVGKMQNTQSQTNGYFGGYISKRQKIGKFEAKKCIDKMYQLQDRVVAQTSKKQFRQVTGRMVTDIEMNGTLRGSVEEMNLCQNLRKNDVLFAECIRTYATVDVNAQQWLHRLSVQLEDAREMKAEVYIPPTKRPNIRTNYEKAPQVDVYGYRPLSNKPFALLSPFEFTQYWCAQPVSHPPFDDDAGELSRWTERGMKIRKDKSFWEGKKKLLPGVHYKVIEPLHNEYFTFPDEAFLDSFRHAWIIKRRPRPYVPILRGLPLPSPAKSAESNARYFSVFFRPWTLLEGREDIPHMSRLGLVENDRDVKLVDLPQFVERTVEEATNFAKSWQEYIQGRVVSEHSARLIRSIMTNTLARGDDDDERELQEQADASDAEDDIDPVDLRADDLRRLMRTATTEDDEEDDASKADKSGLPLKRRMLKKSKNAQYENLIMQVQRIWGQGCSLMETDASPRLVNPLASADSKEHLAGRKALHEEEDEQLRPYSDKTIPKATLYPVACAGHLKQWLSNLETREKAPTAEQRQCLEALIERICCEAREEEEGTQRTSQNEPIFDVLHGLPGAGKSQLLAWIRELFEEELGWTQGVQFVFLAFQNSVAAQINGLTIHHWSGIPTGEEAGTSLTRDNARFATRCQCMRFILVDEISMVSSQLGGVLETITRKVIRRSSPYKRRQEHREDGTTENVDRVFGGVNVLLSGDWWQIKPVGGQAFFSDPRCFVSHVAARGMDLLWGNTKDSVQRCWELTESKRCSDVWYNHFLNLCRIGKLDDDTYNFVLGFPTSAPSGIADRKTIASEPLPTCMCRSALLTLKSNNQDFEACRSASLTLVPKNDGFEANSGLHPRWEAEVYVPWAKKFMELGWTGEELMSDECSECAATRAKRRRVMRRSDEATPELKQAPFDIAPALYAYNVPRYYTLMLRSREYARANNLQLCWATARDVPLGRDERGLEKEQLHEKMKTWLTRHDQETGHIASQLALAHGLPVRLTDAVDRKLKLFRGRRGTIVGWVPHPDEDQIPVDNEKLLSRMPLVIYVSFPGATWKVHEDLDAGVYPVTQVSRTWIVNRNTRVKVRRTGFFLVPDFGSTAHMIQGQSLPAAFADLVHTDWSEPPTDELQVSAYVMLSRAQDPSNIWIFQPFAKRLFNRGQLPGPDILMRKLRGELKSEDVGDAFDKAEEERSKKSKDIMAEEYKCTQCYLAGRTDFMKPPRCFGAYTPALLLSIVVGNGAWTRCLPCRETANRLRAGNGLEKIPEHKAEEEGANTSSEKLQCSACQINWPLEYFSKSAAHHKTRNKAPICNVCDEVSCCATCKKWKLKRLFRDGGDVCQDCEGIFCVGCKANLPRHAFTSASINNAISLRQNVICIECRNSGKTVRSLLPLAGRTCLKCNRNLPTKCFPKDQTGERICTTCLTQELRCSACGEMKVASEYTNSNLKAHKDKTQNTKLVCLSCIERGLTPRDTQLHTCSECKEQYGRSRFDPSHIHHALSHGRHYLPCDRCRAAIHARLGKLERFVRTSKWKCKCKQPIHAERCPLSPTFSGQRRWPGGDHTTSERVDEDDRDFLNFHRPKWWLRACGKV